MENFQQREQTRMGQQTVIVNQIERKTNGMGTAGFVLALITLFLGWIPILGWLTWLLGLIFSLVGISREPKGLAIAGLVISLINIILIVLVGGMILAALGFAFSV